MPLLVLVGFVGGLLTALSPCILPVLPVILAGSAAGGGSRRPYAIVAGLVVSFTTFTLVAGALLRLLHLPQDFLHDAGIVVLLLLAVGLLVPAVGDLLERPFARLGTVAARVPVGGLGARGDAGAVELGGADGAVDAVGMADAPGDPGAGGPGAGGADRNAGIVSGLLLGLALGLVFVPCAGPVLAAVSVAAARERYGTDLVLVTLAYACGAAVPLLAVALVSRRASTHWQALRSHAPVVRRVAGVVIGLIAIAIALNLTTGLTSIPGSTGVESRVDNALGAGPGLRAVSGERANPFATHALAAGALPELGQAPNFTGITAWINTPGGRPISLAQLRGKVVLVDFWTYSCINCQRSLPHVEAWYREYHRYGLEVVGVHSPEFPFEHVVSNVRAAVARLGVDYPVAVDDDLATWSAYGNEYWPAEYLIDQNGEVRHTEFGEGDYSGTEQDIRELLTAGAAASGHPIQLPPPTDVPNRTPTADNITPESYLGYLRLDNDVGNTIQDDQRTVYHLVPPAADELSYGGAWTVHQWEATADGGSTLDLDFTASDVYLVMGGTGTVTVNVGNGPARTVDVSGVPDLYTLVSGSKEQSGLLQLSCSPGVEVYDFTFG